MNSKYILTIAFCFFVSRFFAQTLKEKHADKLYESFAYVQAADIYKDLASKNNTNDKINRRLADCYNKIGDFKSSEIWYKKLVDAGKAEPEELYSYSQILKANGKYNEADAVLNNFYSIKSTDTRGKEYNRSKGILEKIKKEKPFFKITQIEGNSSDADFGTCYFNDKIVFASARKKNLAVSNLHSWDNQSFLDLYSADKDGSSNLKNIQQLNKKINSKFHEGPACYALDGKTMFFTRNNFFKNKIQKSAEGVNNLELFRAKLINNKWEEEKLPFNSSEYSSGHPSLSSNEKTLYFASDMPGGFGGTDIYKIEVKEDGTFGNPVNLGNTVNTEGNEMFPFIHSNGTLFFSSNGHVGFGQLDVFAAMPKKDGTFSSVINLGIPVNSGSDDFALVLSEDEKTGFISSNREGGKGGDDIYAIELIKPLITTKTIKGIAKDENEKPIEGAVVKLTDLSTKETKTLITGVDGAYSFVVDADKEFRLHGLNEKYFDGENKADTHGEIAEVIADIELDRIPEKIIFMGTIRDANTNTPIPNASVKLANTKEKFETTTDSLGKFQLLLDGKKPGDQLDYDFSVAKQGYITKTFKFRYLLKDYTPLKMEEVLDVPMSLEKISVGGDLAKLINIKPIYFDLGKSTIRKDAAIELEKIVTVMNENPNMVVELGSHTDCRATAIFNEKLSDSRAKASAAYIKLKIKKPERIYGKGYGESKLKNDCACEGTVKSTCSEEAHQENRRTEFIIIKMD